jgi:hypothetical protein
LDKQIELVHCERLSAAERTRYPVVDVHPPNNPFVYKAELKSWILFKDECDEVDCRMAHATNEQTFADVCNCNISMFLVMGNRYLLG